MTKHSQGNILVALPRTRPCGKINWNDFPKLEADTIKATLSNIKK